MAKLTILLADNDPDFLATRKEFLELEGYTVTPAQTTVEAGRVLDEGKVGLAVLDVRLVDDDDERDMSGLTLAKTETYRTIPKIILTSYPSYGAVRTALEPVLEGLPPAVDFVSKKEGPQALLVAIRRVLKFDSRRYKNALDMLTEGLQKDYDEARHQAGLTFGTSLGMTIAGTVVVVVSVVLIMMGNVASGILSVVVGIALEMLAYPFFRRSGITNARVDKYHNELLRLRQLEALLAEDEENVALESKEKYLSQLHEMVIQAFEQ